MSPCSPNTFHVLLRYVPKNFLHVMSTSSQDPKSKEVQEVESEVLPTFYGFGIHVQIVQWMKDHFKI